MATQRDADDREREAAPIGIGTSRSAPPPGRQRHAGERRRHGERRPRARPAADQRAAEPRVHQDDPQARGRRSAMATVHGRGSSGGDASTPGTLYVVATPIGNLEDVTLRALRVLKEVALVACEDTRRTARLLQAHGIATATTSYFEHNEKWKGERILEALRGGRSVALVSDAGTPGISDPGFRLVRDARAEGLPVVPVPGPSAAVAALSVSGLPTDRFLFVGFLPPRRGRAAQGARRISPASARRSWSTSRRCAWRRALADMVDGPRRPRRLPLPREHEGARGVRARDALRDPRAARGAGRGEGRDRARDRGRAGGNGGRHGNGGGDVRAR